MSLEKVKKKSSKTGSHLGYHKVDAPLAATANETKNAEEPLLAVFIYMPNRVWCSDVCTSDVTQDNSGVGPQE